MPTEIPIKLLYSSGCADKDKAEARIARIRKPCFIWILSFSDLTDLQQINLLVNAIGFITGVPGVHPSVAYADGCILQRKFLWQVEGLIGGSQNTDVVSAERVATVLHHTQPVDRALAIDVIHPFAFGLTGVGICLAIGSAYGGIVGRAYTIFRGGASCQK
jgi:hypothetical protein